MAVTRFSHEAEDAAHLKPPFLHLRRKSHGSRMASPPSCRRVLQQVGISVFPFLPTATLLGFLHREPPPKACCCCNAVARGPKPRGSGGLAQLNPFRSLSLTGSPTATDTSSPREQGPVCFPAGQALGHQSSSQAAKVQLGSVGRQQEGSTASS